MRHLKLKFLILALATILPTLSSAHDFEVDGIYYNINKDSTTVSVTFKGREYQASTNNYRGNIIIPDSVTYIEQGMFYYHEKTYSVTSIGDYAFSGCQHLTSIVIPNSVTSIGDYAFNSCRSITSVTIPNSVTSIGNSAFYSCDSLTSITIPNSVTSIGNSAFYSCDSLTSITIPNSVSSIKNDTFKFCKNLSSIKIPYSITSIGDEAFAFCSRLNTVTIPNSVSYIGKKVFYSCDSLTSATIFNSTIGESEFDFCRSLNSVTISNSVTSIGSYAFCGCSSLSSVAISNSVTSIGSYAFSKCSSLSSIVIPNSVTYIGKKVFYSCDSLTSATIFNSTIGESEFDFCRSLNSVTISNSVTSIGSYAFCGCSSLSSVAISNSVTSIGSYAFSECSSLSSIVIPNSVTYIGTGAFSKCSALKSVELSKSLGSIEVGAFQECSMLTTISIPESTYSIRSYAFDGCSNLKCVIPKTISSIGENAFRNVKGCIALIDYTSNYDQSLRKWMYLKPMMCEQYYYRNWQRFVSYHVDGSNITLYGFVKLLSATLNGQTYYANNNSITMKGFSYGSDIPITIKCEYGGIIFETDLTIFDLSYSITKRTYNYIWYTVKIESNLKRYNFEYNSDKCQYGDLSIKYYPSGSYFGYVFANERGIKPNVGIEATEIAPNALTLKGTFNRIEGPTYTDLWFFNTNTKRAIRGEEVTVTGLTPHKSYSFYYNIETEEDGVFSSDTKSFTTSDLTFEVLPAQVVSDRKVLIRTNTNGVDDALRFGFEWRRYDAPVEMPSTQSPCPVFDGVMYGALNNLSADTYYKYRPYYKPDDSDHYIYGEWVAFFSGDAATYFEPMVYTSGASDVGSRKAMLKGFVVNGSDNITDQGFEYWTEEETPTRSVDSHMTVSASGTMMNAEINGLTPATTYRYRAFATTDKGTTYGSVLSFTTEEESGVEEVTADEFDIRVKSAGGEVYVKSQSSYPTMQCTIYTINGSIVANAKIETGEDWVSVANLTPGIYILYAVSDNSAKAIRFVVR